MFAKGCVCVCLCIKRRDSRRVQGGVCVFKREGDERRKRISRTNLSSMFDNIFEH